MCANINKPKFGLAVLLSFIFMVAFNWLFHGQLLMDTYNQTPQLWRPMDEMQSFMALCLIKQLLTAVVLVWLFVGGYEGKGIKEGVRFGLAAGLLIGLTDLTYYFVLPVSSNLAVFWLVGGILTGLGIGIISALTYKPVSAIQV